MNPKLSDGTLMIVTCPAGQRAHETQSAQAIQLDLPVDPREPIRQRKLEVVKVRPTIDSPDQRWIAELKDGLRLALNFRKPFCAETLDEGTPQAQFDGRFGGVVGGTWVRGD